MISFARLAKLTVLRAGQIALPIAAAVAVPTPVLANPNCYAGVSQLCRAHWQDMEYASYHDCFEDQFAQHCPGCSQDPQDPSGGGQCTIYESYHGKPSFFPVVVHMI